MNLRHPRTQGTTIPREGQRTTVWALCHAMTHLCLAGNLLGRHLGIFGRSATTQYQSVEIALDVLTSDPESCPSSRIEERRKEQKKRECLSGWRQWRQGNKRNRSCSRLQRRHDLATLVDHGGAKYDTKVRHDQDGPCKRVRTSNAKTRLMGW